MDYGLLFLLFLLAICSKSNNVVLMVAVIVVADFLFFRNRFWERQAVNIGIVLVFAAFYFTVPKNVPMLQTRSK